MKERKEGAVIRKLVGALQLPDDLAKGKILVSMHGQERVWIENFKGISSYSPQEIRLLARGTCICIQGEHLEITTYTKEEIAIEGRILSLSFPK